MSRRPAPVDVRKAALKALAEITANSGSRTQARILVAKQIGVHPNTIRNWELDAAPADVIDPGPSVTAAERDRAHAAQMLALSQLNRDLAAALRENTTAGLRGRGHR